MQSASYKMPGSGSDGKKSSCNVGNFGSIPGLGRSQEEGMATHSSILGFPDSSVGKESTCNAGHSGSISGSGRSAGEGIGYPFQYSWASLVAQLVKNPPTMPETWVQFLGWEDTLEKAKTTHSSILA